MEFLKNPTTVKSLAVQIITACDNYISLKMPEKQFKELIAHYASQHGKKLLSYNGLNPTVTNRIGKKRSALVNIMLSDQALKSGERNEYFYMQTQEKLLAWSNIYVQRPWHSL